MTLRQFSTFLRAASLQRDEWHALFYCTQGDHAERSYIHHPFKVEPDGAHPGIIQHNVNVIGNIQHGLIAHRNCVAQRQGLLNIGHRIGDITRLAYQGDPITYNRRKHVVTAPDGYTIKHVHHAQTVRPNNCQFTCRRNQSGL